MFLVVEAGTVDVHPILKTFLKPFVSAHFCLGKSQSIFLVLYIFNRVFSWRLTHRDVTLHFSGMFEV